MCQYHHKVHSQAFERPTRSRIAMLFILV